MEKELQFVISKSNPFESILNKLRTLFPIQKEASHYSTFTFFDTFDWRLFRQHRCLIHKDKAFQLFDLGMRRLYRSWKRPFTSLPGFYWDFPDDRFKLQLTALLGIRALINWGTVDLDRVHFRVLNEEQRTVVKFSCDTFSKTANQNHELLHAFLRLVPVKGYPTAFNQIYDFFQAEGIPLAGHSLAEQLFFALKLAPGAYQAKPPIQLTPELPARNAAQKIFNTLLQVMHENESGIIQDIDTEFLHDFRVSVRRTRAALSLLKGIFPLETVNEFNTQFSNLGRLTNRLRDLDVYLLNQDYYRALLPEVLRAGIDPLFRSLQQARKVEWEQVQNFLNSSEYTNQLTAWESFIAETDRSDDAPNAPIPIYKVASEIIMKRFQKVIKQGKRIIPQSPDAELHRLRIQCKKLRYSLEFFSELLPEKISTRLQKQLKGLQDNLGEYNDLCVQQKQLFSFLEQNINQNDFSKIEAAAIGGLITQLNQEQLKKRQEFKQAFKAFNSASNKKLYKCLFGV